MLCPCHSKQPYVDCCKPFHEGVQLPKTALQLMRSRYSAYALKLVQYLLDTSRNKKDRKEIERFCNETAFTGLEILEHIDGQNEAYVTFNAHLAQGKADVSFQEKSRFVKVGDRWIYESGIVKRS